jgi:hypothetical protein
VAVKFIDVFLNSYADGDSLLDAVEKAQTEMMKMEELTKDANKLEEKGFVGASWLPVVYQNLYDAPSTWEELKGKGKVDWYSFSQCWLAIQSGKRLKNNPLTSEAIGYELEEIYIPLGLLEKRKKKKQDNFGNDISPESGSNIYLDRDGKNEPFIHEITKIYENDKFLIEVIRNGDSEKSNGTRLLIIGEPGAGKTTFSQKLADWIFEHIEGLVIWISLADLQGINLEDYLRTVWFAKAQELGITSENIEDFFSSYQEKIYLILDGADEMMTEDNSLSYITSQVENLPREMTNVKAVITSRLNVWENAEDSVESNWDTYRNLDFSYGEGDTEDLVGKFIKRWFRFKEEWGKILRKELNESGRERIRDLVRNPLRLCLLCAVWHGDKATLPETKAGLYAEYVKRVYEWKAKIFLQEVYETTDTQQQVVNQKKLENIQKGLNEKLGELARDALDLPQSWYRISQSLVDEILGHDLKDKALELGWLNKIGINIHKQIGIDKEKDNKPIYEPIYAFYHASFQEYFSSIILDDWHFFLNQIPDESSQDNYRTFEPQWKEVILFWFGRININAREKRHFLWKLCGNFNTTLFYCLRGLLLAAEVISEFKDYPYTDEIINEIFHYGFGIYNNENKKWIPPSFGSKVAQDARASLEKTNQRKIIFPLLGVIETCTNGYLVDTATSILIKIGSKNSYLINILKSYINVPINEQNVYNHNAIAKTLLAISETNNGSNQNFNEYYINICQESINNFIEKESNAWVGLENLENITISNNNQAIDLIDNLIRLLQSEYQRQIDNENICLSFTSYPFNYVHDISTKKFTNNPYAINTLETLIKNCNDNNLTLIYSSILLGINLNNRQAVQAIFRVITGSRKNEIIKEGIRLVDYYCCSIGSELETEYKNLIDALINLITAKEYFYEVCSALEKITRGNPYTVNCLINLIETEQVKILPNIELISGVLGCLERITNISQKEYIIPNVIQLLSNSNKLYIFNALRSDFLNDIKRFIVRSFSNNPHLILSDLEKLFDNYESTTDYSTQVIILYIGEIISLIDQGNEKAFNSVLKIIQNYNNIFDDIFSLERGKSLIIDALELLSKIKPNNDYIINICNQIIAQSNNDYNRFKVIKLLSKIKPNNDYIINICSQLIAQSNNDYYCCLIAEHLIKLEPNNILAANTILGFIQHPRNGDSIRIALDNICKINVNKDDAIQALIELMTTTRTKVEREYYGVPAWSIFNQALYTLGEIAINTDNSVAINFLLNLLEISDYRRNNILKSLEKIVVNSFVTIEYLVRFINDCESQLLNFYRECENRSILNEWLEENLGFVIESPWQKATLELIKIREWVNTINKIVEYGSYDLKQYTIRLIINLISSVEDKDVIQLLEKTLLDIFITNDINTMSWIVSYSKEYLSQEKMENNFYRFQAFFTIAWQCAQNLPFSIFRQAWNNPQFTQNIPWLEINGFRDYPEESIEDMMNTVYLLLIDNNNIYSIQSGDQEIVLMFESKNDATGHASLIERRNSLSYSVQAFDREGIKEICIANGCQWQLITDGMPINPPEDYTEQIDLNPESNYQTSPTSPLNSSQIMQVYILLYNPNTENEGIHIIQTGNQDTVLMFESEQDATNYALRLEAQNFPQPSVELIDRDEIERWCTSADYQWQFITEGMPINPPQGNRLLQNRN